jgi:aspartyl-tRNA(Asn)/glutamyl-tRNA(Gln) amidotransferase subunit C
MTITLETVRQIAELARLEFTPIEAEKMQADLNQILDWMDTLNELDTTDVEPLVHLSPEINQWREDIAQNTLPKEQALQNAPQRDGQYFKVPKVIG